MVEHTFAYISSLLRYDPETGRIVWLVKRGNRTPEGSIAGTKDNGGYIVIGIDRKYYKSHRIAWLLAYGEWPPGVIDHINGDTEDNRLNNLRIATQAQNSRNQSKASNNTSGFKGVHWHSRRSKWVASIRVDWKLKHLGYFDTPEEAAKAYDTASVMYHGEFGRPSFHTQRTRVSA